MPFAGRYNPAIIPPLKRALTGFGSWTPIGWHVNPNDLMQNWAEQILSYTAVVIGSWRGFVPLVLARALADNSEGGEVIFIDPSLVDDFWSDPVRVSGWFAQFGADNITHHLHTTQSFVRSEHYRALREVGSACPRSRS